MKINPPKPVIDPTNPFKESLFGRKEFAESLTTLLRNADENLVIFVNAPWGEGKTTFAEMWRTYLSTQQKYDVIYYDAFAADYFDDPFVSFSGEILALVDKRLKKETGSAPRREFKKTAVKLGKRLAGVGMKVGLKALTMGAIDAAHLSEMKEAATEAATGTSEVAAEIIEDRIEHYTKEKGALADFKASLGKLAKLVREQQGFPLTIVVDELDRCRPDFALGLLERIKHLFAVEGVAFVLLVNKVQIERYVRTVYGDSDDAGGYLLKFGNLFVDLPTRSADAGPHDTSRHEFCRSLFKHYQLPIYQDGRGVAASMYFCADHFSLTLREIEKTFTVMALYYGSLPPNVFTDSFLVPLLASLKIKNPELYLRLANRSVSLAFFFETTRFDRLIDLSPYDLSANWVKDFLRFCLLTKDEFEELPDGTGPRDRQAYATPYRLDRQRLIPVICARIDRFTLQDEK